MWGGVVNILSPRGEGDLSGSIHTEIGSYNTHSLSTFLSASNETGDFFLSYSNIDTEGFNARESDSDKDKDGYQNTTIHSKLGFNVNDQSRLQWVTHRVEGENEYDDCFGSDDCESAFNHLINKISLNIDLENIQHHVAYSVTDVDRRFFTDGEAGYQTEGSVKRFEYLSHYDVGTSTLIAGFDTEKEQVGDDERSQLGSYIEYKIEPLRNLFLAAGVRRDDHDDFGLHFSQRASVAYTFEWDTLDLRLRSSYGTGFRAPSLSEVALNEDSEPLEEETSTGYEAGFDLIFNNGTELQFTYFDQQIEDEIYYDMTSFYYLQDAGESKSSGAEIFAQVPLGSNWALATNYTYNDTEDSDGDQRARRPKHQGNVSFSYYNDDNTVTSALNLRGAKDAVDIDDDKLAGYVVADFSLSYEVNYQVKLSASVKNLLDKDYEEVRGFNTSDRAYYFGAQIDL